MKSLMCVAVGLMPMVPAHAADSTTPHQAHYEPTVKSLKQHEVPEWFQDAKLGIFMHWGPHGIPGVATTWYARWMYQQGLRAIPACDDCVGTSIAV